MPLQAFNEIWDHHPELQNRFSSSWWFFLLLPKQEYGYGPRQMMFTYASRMGKMIGVADNWQRGMTFRPKASEDLFPTRVAGWIYDGKIMHKDVVFTPALAELNYHQQTNTAWNSNGYGAELRASIEKSIGVDAHFKGPHGEAEFTIWADDYGNEVEVPQIVEVYGPKQGKLGNIQTVAWRRFRFKGQFSHQGRSWEDEGLGYFQRVLMNIPLHPWMWNYTIFADGSVFSSFILYGSLNYLRRQFRPLPKFLSRRRFHIAPSAYFYHKKTGITHYFESSRIIPQFGSKREVVGFYIQAQASSGDFFRFKLKVNDSAGYNMKRKLFRNLYSVYSWTEFMVETTNIIGSIGSEKLGQFNLGTGFGNTEYSMGISL